MPCAVDNKALPPIIAQSPPPVRKPVADGQRLVWQIMANNATAIDKAVLQACAAVVGEDPPARWRKENAVVDLLDAYRSTARAEVKPAIIQALTGAFEQAERAGPEAVDAFPTALLTLLHDRMPDECDGLKLRVRSALVQQLAAQKQLSLADAEALLDPRRPVPLEQMKAALDRGTGPDAAPAYACRELGADGRFTDPVAADGQPPRRMVVKDGNLWMNAFGSGRSDSDKVDFVVVLSSATPQAHQSRERLIQALRQEHGDRLGEVHLVAAELNGLAKNSSHLWTTSVVRAHERLMEDMPIASVAEVAYWLGRCVTTWSSKTPLQREEFLAAARAEFLGGLDLHHQRARAEVVRFTDPLPFDHEKSRPRVTDGMLTDDFDPTEGRERRVPALTLRPASDAPGEAQGREADRDEIDDPADDDLDREDIPVDLNVPDSVEGRPDGTPS